MRLARLIQFSSCSDMQKASASRPLRVLVVEDSAPCARLMEIALTEAGHAVTLVRTTDSALFAVVWEEFDALVCDLLLPDGHGCEIIRAFRQRSFPVFAVAVSGLPRDGCEHIALAAGFDRFLQKPFLPGELALLFA
jgi:DNA-binding response OmpR family regulator